HHPRHMARRVWAAADSPDRNARPLITPRLGRSLIRPELGRRTGLGLIVGLLSLAVAVVVAIPAATAVGRPGPTLGASAPHIAALRGGLVSRPDPGQVLARPAAPPGPLYADSAAGATGSTDSFAALALSVVGPASLLPPDARAAVTAAAVAANPARLMNGPYGPDGQLRPAAPLVMASYTVRQGDTLYSVAAHFGLQFGSLWWANKLSDPRTLHVGKVLRIPPVDGVVYAIKAGDTVESIAAAFHVAATDIVEFNQLTTDELPAGEEIMIPDASGPPLPKPAVQSARAGSPSSGGSSAVGSSSYHGRMVWPVPGGWISQYFHASHPALDIAAPMGTRVLAAAAGKVIYAGWGNNGGGYQVWISHGQNLYTTYNHMELVSVHVGQTVAAGQQVGRVGMTGWATGPHCHFEVWIGKVWNGGYRVNPLNYLR
ncbi:MAG: peptidoglycan DD-metalloendopeptidase family protein, partial [Candidatus Limnocylindrales bacterium]